MGGRLDFPRVSVSIPPYKTHPNNPLQNCRRPLGSLAQNQHLPPSTVMLFFVCVCVMLSDVGHVMVMVFPIWELLSINVEWIVERTKWNYNMNTLEQSNMAIGTLTFWRCISYWRWGISISMLAYQSLITFPRPMKGPSPTTSFCKAGNLLLWYRVIWRVSWKIMVSTVSNRLHKFRRTKCQWWPCQICQFHTGSTTVPASSCIYKKQAKQLRNDPQNDTPCRSKIHSKENGHRRRDPDFSQVGGPCCRVCLSFG